MATLPDDRLAVITAAAALIDLGGKLSSLGSLPACDAQTTRDTLSDLNRENKFNASTAALMQKDIQVIIIGAGRRSPSKPDRAHCAGLQWMAIVVLRCFRTSTFSESGLPEMIAPNWWGLMVPAKTPKSVIDRIARDVALAGKQPLIVWHQEANGSVSPHRDRQNRRRAAEIERRDGYQGRGESDHCRSRTGEAEVLPCDFVARRS